MKRTKLPSVPREKRPALPPHTWRREYEGDVLVYPLLLVRASGIDALDTSERSERPVYGPFRICDRCGCCVVYGRWIDDEGFEWPLTVYGVDEHSLSPMRTPGCELLSLPARADVDAAADNDTASDATRAA